MVNWKDIHPDFTEELQREWEEEGFGYEEVQKLIDSGLQIKETEFYVWLRDNKKLKVKELLGNDIQRLRTEYNNRKKNLFTEKVDGKV